MMGVAVIGGSAIFLYPLISSENSSANMMVITGLLFAAFGLGAIIFLVHFYLTRVQRAKASARLRAHDVDNMSGKEFEVFLGTVLTARGYMVKKIAHSQDGGVDIIARKDKETYSIQAKRYKAGHKADRRAITDAVAGIKYANCTHAMAITNSYFTKAALEYAQKTGCTIIDRDELGKWLVELSE